MKRKSPPALLLRPITRNASRIILITLLILLRGSAHGFAQPASILRLDGTSIDTSQLSAEINRLLPAARVTGLSIAVFNHDRPVYTRSFGYANTREKSPLDTAAQWWACSFSKAVFAYCVMRYVEKGIISLDTPLVSYLNKPLYEYSFTKKSRGYQDIRDDRRYERITARMCLDHSTGFPNYRGFEPDGKLKIKFDPGTQYGYSGEGIYLLQFVLEQITGKPFETMVQEEVFHPLGMTHSSYVWQTPFDANHVDGHDSLQQPYEFDRRTVSHAAGSMYTTIGDFSRFYEALLHQQGLQKASFREMFKPQLPVLSKQGFGPNALIMDRTSQNTPIWYGLGFGLLKTPYGIAFFKEGHSEGWQHYSIAFPDKGIAIILMSNSDQGESIYKELLSTAIADKYTPWYWVNYIPYNAR